MKQLIYSRKSCIPFCWKLCTQARLGLAYESSIFNVPAPIGSIAWECSVEVQILGIWPKSWISLDDSRFLRASCVRKIEKHCNHSSFLISGLLWEPPCCILSIGLPLAYQNSHLQSQKEKKQTQESEDERVANSFPSTEGLMVSSCVTSKLERNLLSDKVCLSLGTWIYSSYEHSFSVYLHEHHL